jgi:carbon storage regulator CsrA
MLVLERKLNEKIVFYLPDGQKITVEPVRIAGNGVRLGIIAPHEVDCLREEVPRKPRQAA